MKIPDWRWDDYPQCLELIDPGTSSKGGSFEQFETRAGIIFLSFEKTDGELGAFLKSSWDP